LVGIHVQHCKPVHLLTAFFSRGFSCWVTAAWVSSLVEYSYTLLLSLIKD
jgi:hypothetical protein